MEKYIYLLAVYSDTLSESLKFTYQIVHSFCVKNFYKDSIESFSFLKRQKIASKSFQISCFQYMRVSMLSSLKGKYVMLVFYNK